MKVCYLVIFGCQSSAILIRIATTVVDSTRAFHVLYICLS